MGYGIIRRGLRSAARMARRYSPYSVPAAGAVGMSVAAGYRYGRTVTKTKKKSTSGSGVTNQYNATLQYRKRRMPRRKRGQWKRFVRKVRAVNMRGQASRTFVFNNSIQVDATGGNQAVDSIALYGGAGLSAIGSSRGYDDVAQIFGQNNLTEDLQHATGYLHFESAVLDVTVRNNAAETAEVDMYEVWCYSDNPHQVQAPTQANVETLHQAIQDAALNQTTMSNQLTLEDRGATPFSIPAAFSQYRMEIKSKRKYLIGSGQAFTYQMRDPRNHTIQRAKFQEKKLWSMKGLTKFILIIGKAATNRNQGTGVVNLDIGHTRSYVWKNSLKNNIAAGHN